MLILESEGDETRREERPGEERSTARIDGILRSAREEIVHRSVTSKEKEAPQLTRDALTCPFPVLSHRFSRSNGSNTPILSSRTITNPRSKQSSRAAYEVRLQSICGNFT